MNEITEKNLKEFDSHLSELEKDIKNYTEKCPRKNTNLKKSEDICQRARKHLNDIMHHCDKMCSIYNRDEQTKYHIGQKYGDGFVERFGHFTYNHHDGSCMKNECEFTVGGVGHISVALEEFKSGHRLKSFQQNLTQNNTEGDNAYA